MRRSKGDPGSNVLETDYLGNLKWFFEGVLIRKSMQTGLLVYGVGLDVFVEIESILVRFLEVILTRCRKLDVE